MGVRRAVDAPSHHGVCLPAPLSNCAEKEKNVIKLPDAVNELTFPDDISFTLK